MAKIKQLSPHIANLIAAGEVVERPASVVKELVENAVDAGASSVTVELQNGGMTFLRVTDDGCGMAPEDAKTAFLRHATSKLSSAQDLEAISTMGFRGEALAAISSVSRVDLLTRTQDAATGCALHLEAGKVTEESEAGCPAGTTIIIRNLFYNTPARMKFMKSDAAESAGAISAVQKQALAHPDVSFRMLKDGQEVFQTPGDGQLKSAVYCLYGREFTSQLVPVDSRWEQLHVWGYVTRPTATRGNRSYQQFFVNDRPVKSRMMATALEEAYKNQMMTGRFPGCVLHVELPANQVDVNVHPAKTEVKFLSEKAVFDAIHYGVLATLNKTPGRPDMRLDTGRAPAAEAASGFFKAMSAQEFRQTMAGKPPQVPAAQSGFRTSVAPVSEGPAAPLPVRSQVSFPARHPAQETGRPEASAAPAQLPPLPQKTASLPPLPEASAREPIVPAAEAPSFLPPLPEAAPQPAQKQLPEEDLPPAQQAIPLPQESIRVVGEVLDTYLIAEMDGAVYFIDKHAAHERILFEKLKQEDHPIMAQGLLVPLTAELDREEAAAVLENRPLLLRCGFDADDLGDGSVLLRQIPSDVDPEDAVDLLSQLAGDLLHGRTLAPEALRDELLHTIACKAAIKAGYHTQSTERDSLVRQVLTRDDIKYCPHGRPVCIRLTQGALEKQFKRV